MSLIFDGVDDIVNVGNVPGSRLFSIFAWIAPQTLGESSEGAIFAHGATVDPRVNFCMDSIDRIKLEAVNAVNRGQWCTANSTIVLNAWQSVGVTLDGSISNQTPTFYINGAVSARTVLVGSQGIMSADTQVGYIGNVSVTSRTFKGYIGEVALWNRVLSAEEFAALHVLGVSAIPDYVLYLPFDDGRTQDLSASHFAPTVTGALASGNPLTHPAGRSG